MLKWESHQKQDYYFLGLSYNKQKLNIYSIGGRQWQSTCFSTAHVNLAYGDDFFICDKVPLCLSGHKYKWVSHYVYFFFAN